MVIRSAQQAEAVALQGLQRRSSAVWDAYREELEAHPDAIERLSDADIAAGRVRVAVDGAELLGFSAVLAFDGDAEVELDGLFVEPGVMGRGVGRALVEDAAAWARDGGAKAMTVIAGPEAEGFYFACGFVRVADASTRFGPAARLRLAL
jgi:GNAT superfamily N-acetyltransferase